MLKYWLKKNGFTLVELIIVITILAILATISFISFKNYSWNARDGNRIATLKSIEKWLNLYTIKAWEYPNPDEFINISTGSYILIKQWVIWKNITQIIKLNKEVKDPKDDNFYIYSTSYNKQIFQLGTYLEENNISSYISKTYANIDYTNRYFYSIWNQVWIIMKNDWTPVWKEDGIDWNLELWNENTTQYKVFFSNNSHSWTISGTWSSLTQIIQETQSISTNTPSQDWETPWISCNENEHVESWICVTNTKTVSCIWSTPWSGYANIWNWTLSIPIDWETPSWTHVTTTPWACEYQCKIWTYFNGSSCVLSDIWYYVNTPWAIIQTQCPSWQITSQNWSTNINQCYIPKFTQICNTLSSSDYYNTIIYTNVSWLEIWRVDYNWNPINWNPWSLPIDGHIVVCGENISDRFVLKAMNQWAYWIWGYDTLWATSHPSYWNYYIFWNGELESWWVSEDVAETITWESSTSEGKEQMQGPCEPGYHVPTYYEWRSIVLLMSGANVSNSLKLPFSGIRYQNDANVIFQWQLAYYWTSSPDSSWGGAHYVSPSSDWQLFSWGHYPNTSISVRCFKNDSF